MVPPEEQKKWLENCGDDVLISIAKSANNYYISRYGEALTKPQFRTLERNTPSLRQLIGYRNAFHHPEEFEAPQLEWDAIIPIQQNLKNALSKTYEVYDKIASKGARQHKKRLQGFENIINETPVCDPAVLTPETFSSALNTAIHFHESRVGAFLVGCKSSHDALYFDLHHFNPGLFSQILPLHFNQNMMGALIARRAQHAHTFSGPLPANSIIGSYDNPIILLRELEKSIKSRKGTVPEIENPITQFADSLPSPTRGGGKPTPPPEDNSTLEHHSTHWQDRLASESGLGRSPIV